MSPVVANSRRTCRVSVLRATLSAVLVFFFLVAIPGGLAAHTGDIRPAAFHDEERVSVVPAAGASASSLAGSSSSFSFIDNSAGLDKLGWEIGMTEFEMFDWTGDGHADLLTIGDHGSPKLNSQQGGLMVFSGDGAGAWSVKQEGGTNWGYGGIAVRQGGFVTGMHHNNAQSGCGSKIIDACMGEMGAGLGSAGETYGMFGVDYGDFDNDGDLDVGASSFGYGNGLQVYRRDPQTWTNVGISKAGNVDSFFDWADVNADGNLDGLAGADIGKVTLGDGKGGWTRGDTGVPAEAWHLSYGDLNDDGFLDIAYVADGPNNSTVPHVSLYVPGTGAWADSSSTIITTLNTSTPAEANWQYVGVTDADADGTLDLLAAGRVGLVVFKGDGKGGFTRAHTWNPGEMVWWYAFETGVDVDWNGLPDVIGLYERETGKKNEAHFLRNMGTAVTPGVLQYPRGGEKFPPGSIRTVRWLAQGQTVGLEISTTGKGGPWTPIGGGSNDGQMDLKVPNTPSKNCYIKLTAGTHTWTNARPFEIIGSSGPAPLVTQVTAPNGGENLSVGSTFNVDYNVGGGSLPATGTLELSTSGASGPWTKVTDLAGVQAGANSYQWTAPNSPSTTAVLRLSLKDSSPTPQSASDDSNGAFTIWAPPAGPVLARAEVTPAASTLFISEKVTLSAKAFDVAGNELSAAQFAWTVTGSAGTLVPSGATAEFTATSAASSTIEVTAILGAETKQATATVDVVTIPPGQLVKATIDPAAVSGKVGEVVTLKAAGLDSGGKPIAGVEFTWTVTGTVVKLGSTTGEEITITLESSGSAEVVVKATLGGKQASAKATVIVAKQPFLIRWDLVFLIIIGAVALVASGAAVAGYRKKKRREAQQYQQHWAYQQESMQTGWSGGRGIGWQ